jgi:hypothetical protein
VADSSGHWRMVGTIIGGQIDGLNIHVNVVYLHVMRIPGLHKYSYRGFKKSRFYTLAP